MAEDYILPSEAFFHLFRYVEDENICKDRSNIDIECKHLLSALWLIISTTLLKPKYLLILIFVNIATNHL